MKKSVIIPLGLALVLAVDGVSARSTPKRNPAEAAAEPLAPAVRTSRSQSSDQLFSVKVIMLKQGAEVASFSSILSADDAAVYCSGTIKGPEGLYWRMFVRADVQPDAQGVLELSVEDLKLVKGLNDAKSIEIFSSTQPCDGEGNYLCGEVQGMQLRVELKKIAKSSARSVQ